MGSQPARAFVRRAQVRGSGGRDFHEPSVDLLLLIMSPFLASCSFLRDHLERFPLRGELLLRHLHRWMLHVLLPGRQPVAAASND
jgi:hypothetical protein